MHQESARFSLSEQLFTVFDKADEHDNGRSHKTDEEHHFKHDALQKPPRPYANCSVFPTRRDQRFATRIDPAVTRIRNSATIGEGFDASCIGLAPQSLPDAINSAQYAARTGSSLSAVLEVVGRGRLVRRLARVALPARRAAAPVALGVFAWFGWSVALGNLSAVARANPVRCAASFCSPGICGVLWYMGNCYWVRDTMMQYGDMPPLAPTLLLVGYSLVLGLYFGLFGLAVATGA
jgi:hypothetical protein